MGDKLSQPAPGRGGFLALSFVSLVFPAALDCSSLGSEELRCRE